MASDNTKQDTNKPAATADAANDKVTDTTKETLPILEAAQEKPKVAIPEKPPIINAVNVTPKPDIYRVADGKSIIGRRGIIDAGEKIDIKDCRGEQEAFDDFIKRGLIVKEQ